jgi:hypothetical protein
MQDSNVKSVMIENASALERIGQQHKADLHYGAYIGMDVHKDTITLCGRTSRPSHRRLSRANRSHP